MLKAFGGIILFIFFFVVFIVLLVGTQVLRMIRRMHRQLRDAADQQARRYSDETGRQRQQYGQRQQRAAGYDDNDRYANGSRGSAYGQSNDGSGYQSQTATGETIVDHRSRNSRKIIDDGEGEYVDFQEEP